MFHCGTLIGGDHKGDDSTFCTDWTAGDDSNMKMKMKNNKTMLALLVVAALALCSVAVVANDSDTDAAASETTDISGNMTVPTGFTNNIFVYTAGVAWDSVITVPSDVTYSGTISYGYREGSGTVADPYVYTTIASITLTDANDTTVTIFGLSGTPIVVESGADNTDITVDKGTVYIDYATSTAFTGTVKASSLVVTIDNSYGLYIASTGAVYGDVKEGVIPANWVQADGAFSTVILSGTGYIGVNSASPQTLNVGTAGATYQGMTELIIADGASISNDSSAIYGSVVLSGFADWYSAILIGSNGDNYVGVPDALGNITFNDVDLTHSYKVMAIVDDAAYYAYVGDVTIAASTTNLGVYTAVLSSNTLGSVALSVINITANNAVLTTGLSSSTGSSLAVATTPASPGQGEIGYRSGSIAFNKDIYTFVTGYGVGTSVATFTANAYTGIITSAGLVNGDTFILVLEDASGNYVYFFGTATVTTGVTGLQVAAINSMTVVSSISTAGQITYNAASNQVVSVQASTYLYAYNLTTDLSATSAVAATGIVTFPAFGYGNDIFVVAGYAGTWYIYIGEVSTGAVTSGANLIGLDCFTENGITYYTTGYTFVTAGNMTDGTAGTLSSDGKIVFDSLSSGDTIFVVLSDGTKNYVWYGTVTLNGSDVVTLLTSTVTIDDQGADVVTTSPAVQQISKNGTVTVTDTVTTITVNSILTVDGTLTMYYKAANASGVIVNAPTGVIDVTGKIAYQVYTTSTTAPLTCVTGTINAVSYRVAGTAPLASTFYYTTLTSAIANSSDYTVYGTIDVLVDTTLTGTSATANKVTVATNSTLRIGSAATVTLPSTTQITFVGTGLVNVASGKFVVSATVADYSVSQVNSEVLTVNSTSKTYTDVVTALSGAASGEVVKLRKAATISTSAVVGDGVTLNGNGFNVTVAAGGSLIVNGTVTSVAAVTIDGASGTKSAAVLTLNTTTFSYTGAFTLSGVLNFGTTYNNSEALTGFGSITVVAASSSSPAIVNVHGNVKISNSTVSAGVNYVTFNVDGTLVANVDIFSSTTNETVNVSGTFTAKANSSIETAVVTGNGTLAGSTTAVIITVKTLTVGTPATTVDQAINEATVKATLAASGIAYVYGSFDSDIVITNAGGVSTVYYLGLDVIYATVYEKTASKTIVSAISNPVVEGYNFIAWYTSSSFASEVPIANTIGTPTSVFGYVTIKTYDITLVYTANGYWSVNGTPYIGGNITVNWAATYEITFIADDGYALKNSVLYVNGSAMPLGYEPKTGDVISFGGSVVLNNMTLTYTQNGYWLVDGVKYTGGLVTIPSESSVVITFVAENGYELKDYKIFVNGSAMPSTYTPAVGDIVTFEGTVKEKVLDDGMDISTILLIIITIVIVIMAIVIALRLMRS